MEEVRIPAFPFVKDFLKGFPAAGLYLVGGAVRDALLGRGSKDHDFVVTGVEAGALEAFLAERGAVDFVGHAFGIFKFTPSEGPAPEGPLDVALPRRDFAAGTGGYRDVRTQSDPALPIEEDLTRRDFTVNAMAWDLRAGRLVDPHDGRRDLGRRLLNAVGDPDRRFKEDYTRLLRGLRFAAQLGFRFEPHTWNALRAGVRHLDDLRPDGSRLVPYEIVARELLKGLGADPGRTFDLWQESGALAELLPELRDPRAARLRLLRAANARVSLPGLVAALLFELGADGAETVVERLRLSAVPEDGVTPSSVRAVVEAATVVRMTDPDAIRPSLLRRLFMDLPEGGRDALAVADAAGAPRLDVFRRRVAAVLERARRPLLAGSEVLHILEIEPGPDVGRALDLLIDAQAEGIIRRSEEAERLLKERFER
jgi:tRNA nucleotidyltransferase/poly(A) polymerase